KKKNDTLVLLHAVPAHRDPIVAARTSREAENEMRSAALKIKHAGGVDYECVTVTGHATKAILKAISSKNIDLVIMGTNDETEFSRAILGSITMRIIEKAECPVITVPSEAPLGDFRTITYASTYNSSDLKVLNSVIEIAKPFRAQINILHIADSSVAPSEEKKRMKSFMDQVVEQLDYNNFSFQLLAGGNVQQELENYLEENPADLLILSTDDHTFFERFFRKSLTREIAYNPKLPVMVFHHRTRLSANVESDSE
ncbi:MAG: universal stress protein, partial [Bacteroidia bacterium]